MFISKKNSSRMGDFYRRVPANTVNGDLLFALRDCPSFYFDKSQSVRRKAFFDAHANNLQTKVMSDLPTSECHPLGSFVEALEDATCNLLADSRCQAVKGIAVLLQKSSSQRDDIPWSTTVRLDKSKENISESVDKSLAIYKSHGIIFSCGGKPIEISLTSNVPDSSGNGNEFLPTFYSMDKMVDPQYCLELHQSEEFQHKQPAVWAVIGGSHSAMLIVKNLVEAGAKKVINIYRSDLRFMHQTEEGWLKYD